MNTDQAVRRTKASERPKVNKQRPYHLMVRLDDVTIRYIKDWAKRDHRSVQNLMMLVIDRAIENDLAEREGKEVRKPSPLRYATD